MDDSLVYYAWNRDLVYLLRCAGCEIDEIFATTGHCFKVRSIPFDNTIATLYLLEKRGHVVNTILNSGRENY